MSTRKIDLWIIRVLQNPSRTSLSINEIIDLLKEQGQTITWAGLRYALKVMENTGFVTLYKNIDWKSTKDPKYLFSLNERHIRESKLNQISQFLSKWSEDTYTKSPDIETLVIEYETVYRRYQDYCKLIEKLVDKGVEFDAEPRISVTANDRVK